MEVYEVNRKEDEKTESTCIHMCIHTAYIVCLWSTMCHCSFENKKWLLGASVSHVHSEALLRTMSAVSIVTIEVALVALKSKLEVKMSATKLPSCVTGKT